MRKRIFKIIEVVKEKADFKKEKADFKKEKADFKKKKESMDFITPQYRHIKELSKLKYEAEEKREQNLIQQASQMQTVFSFMTAAIFMAMSLCVQYRGKISLKFFLISLSFIMFFLLLSLVLSSLGQWRWKIITFPDVKDIKQFVLNSEDFEKAADECYQIDQWINLIATVQEEKAKLNDRRVKLIMKSMICFYCAIATIVISYIVVIFKLI